MQVNKEFLDLLAMIAKINTSVSFQPGDKIRTVNPGNSHIYSGKYPDGIVFEEEFNVFDIPDFMRAVKLVGVGCEMTVSNQVATLTGMNRKLTYYGCASVLVNSKINDLRIPNIDAEVVLQRDVVHDAVTAAKSLSASHITFESTNGVQKIKVHTIGMDGSPSMEFTVGADAGCANFKFNVPTEVFNVPPADYVLKFASAGLAIFETENGAVHGIGVEVVSNNGQEDGE